jgi:hypothetical protein
MDRLLREGNPPAGQLPSPKPQYKKPGVDEYAPVEGQHGAPFAILKDASGNVISPATDAKLEQVKSELELVKSELQTIKANQTSGDQKVQLSGNDVVIGLLADRPPASEMRGRGYYAWDETDGHKLKYSDGTNWVVNQ